MIPKILHYIWLSEDKMDLSTKMCLRSWQKNAPDYEIRRWSLKDFDISSMPIYVQMAIKSRKWAFACDYLRLYVLYQYGGFYLDSDVYMYKVHMASFQGRLGHN